MDYLISAGLGAVFGFMVGMMAGSGISNHYWKDEAAARGHAEYHMNEHGQSSWRWKPAATQPTEGSDSDE